MPNVAAEKLMDIASALLVAAGASQEEASVIAKYNIGAKIGRATRLNSSHSGESRMPSSA